MTGVDLGKQIGPLPTGAWIAVVGTGLAIAYYARNAQANSADPTVVNDTSSQDGVGTGVNGQWVDVTPPTSPPATQVPQDNDEWGRQVIDLLVADGYDAAVVQSAIAKALQGESLSAQEWVLWKLAITKHGAPPFPLDVVPHQSVPGPVKPPAKPPAKHPTPQHRIYMIRPGDTLVAISKRMYGNNLHADAIFNANKRGTKRAPWLPNPGFLVSGDRGKPGLRHVGRRLLIP